MLDRAAQALKDWRLHAKALDDYREGKIGLAEARRRWDQTTKVGLAGADRFDKQAEIYKKAATTCKIGRHPTLDRLDQLACRNADGFSSALTGNAPRFFRPPPWCCAVPPNSQHRPQLLPPHPGR
jgi:hypothetical protein